MECAIAKYVDGKDYIKAKELAERLETTSYVVGAALSAGYDWPLEDSGFGSSGVTYRITIGE